MRIFNRAVYLDAGNAMIITDLHGSGDIYQHLRDRFLHGYEKGELHQFILCGDLLHASVSGEEDNSLEMLLDVMRLQTELGEDTILMLCGNHEMPHIYGQTLARGHTEYTHAFEHAINKMEEEAKHPYTRSDIHEFLCSLPFYIFTRAGVMLSHAGPAQKINTPEIAAKTLNFDHKALIQSTDEQMAKYDTDHARQQFARNIGVAYDDYVWQHLGIKSADDPRYDIPLRTFALNSSEDYALLWDILFTRNELEFPNDMRRVLGYQKVVNSFLHNLSAHLDVTQHTVVSGHIPLSGGHMVVEDRHLRLATYTHANPRSAGQFLIMDCSQPVTDAEDLVSMLHQTIDG